MNYIREINSFYDWLETNSVSDSAINLWHGLLHVNNKASYGTEWKEEFTVAISTLMVKTSLSKSSIIRARNQLKQCGRIDFRERKGNQSAVYRIIAFHTDTQNGTQSGTQSDTKTDTQTMTQNVSQTDTINKPNINQTISSFNKEAKEEYTEQEIDQKSSSDFDLRNLENIKKEKNSAKKEKSKYFSIEAFRSRLLELGTLERHADDWIQVRKDKRASFTESVIDGVIRECEKHNYPFPKAIRHCAEKNWQGFKYHWLEKKENEQIQYDHGINGKTGNSTRGLTPSGKISGRQILARRLNQQTSTNSEGGNITIDIEAVYK